MNDSAGRHFVAVALPPELQGPLAERLAPVLRPLPGRGVPPHNWHLTLRFLGDTTAAVTGRVLAELRAADLGPAFDVRLGGLGAFPHPARAAVLWVGLERGVEPLSLLAAAVEEAVQRAGLAPEPRPFRAHLTVHRLRPPRDVRPLIDDVVPLQLSFGVAEVVLYRSVPGAGAPRYEVVERLPLGE